MKASSFKTLFGSKRSLLAHAALEHEEDVGFFQIPTSSPPPSSPVVLQTDVPGSHEKWYDGSSGITASGHTPPRSRMDQSPSPPPVLTFKDLIDAHKRGEGAEDRVGSGAPSSSPDSKRSSPGTIKTMTMMRRGFVRRAADENGFDTVGWNEMPPRSPLKKLVAMRFMSGGAGGGTLNRTAALSQMVYWAEGKPVPAMKVRILGPPTGAFEKDYEAVEVLHQESQKTLSLCLRRTSGELRACRTVLKQGLFSKEDVEGLQGEIQMMRLLGSHPHIAQLHSVYEDDFAVRLVTEYCAGRPVAERVLLQETWTERDVQRAMRGILEVVRHCHDSFVVHRDVRLGAFILEDGPNPVVKALDFSSAMFIAPGEDLTEKVGTPLYAAPEVLDRKYGLPGDVWSAGVCLHILLSGRAPFLADTLAELRERTRKAELDLTHSVWEHISPAAKDLLQSMLAKDPSERPTARDILDHPWMKEVLPAVDISRFVYPHLQDLVSLSTFHQETLSALAESLSEKDIGELWKMLAAKDEEEAGCVGFEILHDCISRLGRPEVDSRMAPLMRMIGTQVDLEERGRVDREALVAATERAVRKRWEGQLATGLRRADVEHTGRILSHAVWEVCKIVGIMDQPDVATALVDPRLCQGEFIESESFLLAIHNAGHTDEQMETQILML